MRQRTRVFVSYDFDHDKVLKDFIIGQARLPDSPFQVPDYSLKEAAPQRDWEAKALAAIGRADKFVVMLGPRSRLASGVRKEVTMAKSLGKPRSQIIGYRDGSRRWAVPDAGVTYSWNRPNPKKLLA